MDDKNIKISGNGVISTGEYENISAYGSIKLLGDIKCLSLSTSGSIKCQANLYAENISTHGSAYFETDVKSKSVTSSGSFNVENSLTTDNFVGNGSIRVGADFISNETAKIHGAIICNGNTQAKNIYVKFSSKSMFSCVKGNKINIFPKRLVGLFKRKLNVSTSILGDDIILKNVKCPKVTGRIIKIEKGCQIDLVEYSESLTISKKARVYNTKKI